MERVMDFRAITCATGGGIARITLNRPAQLHTISPELLEDLDRACALVEGDAGVRAVTLTAAGRTFCAGADLRAVRELSPDPVRWSAFMGLWHRVFDRIEALPVPVIAGVHGLALAGGLELVVGGGPGSPGPAASSGCGGPPWSSPTRRRGSATSTPTSAWSRAAGAASACRA